MVTHIRAGTVDKPLTPPMEDCLEIIFVFVGKGGKAGFFRATR